MTALLNSILFAEDTKDTLIKIMTANGAQDREMTLALIDTLADLGSSAVKVNGVPTGEYALVLESDLGKSTEIALHLYNTDTHEATALGIVNIDAVAHSGIFYREDFSKAQETFEASAQDNNAEEQFEDDCRKISALRASDFKAALAPYITDEPEFFHELLQALDLLTIDYTENLLALLPDEQFTASELGTTTPPRRVLN